MLSVSHCLPAAFMRATLLTQHESSTAQHSTAQRSAAALGMHIAEVVWVLAQGSLLCLMKFQQSKIPPNLGTLQSCSKQRACQ